MGRTLGHVVGKNTLSVLQMWSLPEMCTGESSRPGLSVSSGFSVSENRKGATEPSRPLWHYTPSTKRCLTETNDQRSFRNNFRLIWSKFSTREQYTQSQTVRLHPGPHKSMFTERTRKILKFTARVMGNFPEQAGCWAPPSAPSSSELWCTEQEGPVKIATSRNDE